MYWKPEHQQAVELFLLCASASTSAHTRQYLYNTILYPVFTILIEKAMQKHRFNREDREDCQQLCHIKMHNVLQTRLKQQYLKGIFQYLWVVAQNTINSYKREKTCVFTSLEAMTEHSDYNELWLPQLLTTDYSADRGTDLIDIRLDILQCIDNKMNEQNEMNVAYLYLTTLRDYLIANDFDGINFKQYAKEKLGWKESHFNVMNSLLNIRTKEFRTEKAR